MQAPPTTANATAGMTREEFQRRRMEERRAKNREAAAESRRRVKQRIQALESRLEKTEEENVQLRALLTSLLQQQQQQQQSAALASGQQVHAANPLLTPGFGDANVHQFNGLPSALGCQQTIFQDQLDQLQLPNELDLNMGFPSLEFAELLVDDLLGVEDGLIL